MILDLVSVILFISCLTLAGNTPTDSLKYNLTERGFENVSVALEDEYMLVAYENRVYRYEIRAMREVMAIISATMEEDIQALESQRAWGSEQNESYLTKPDKRDAILIPQNRGIPLAAISITADEYLPLSTKASDREFASATSFSFDVSQIWRKTQGYEKANTSFHKLDIVVHPMLKSYFGDPSEPVKLQLSLAPAVSMTLWRGMSLSAQLVIPLYNKTDKQSEKWWPGLLTMNQTLRFPGNIFASLTMGYFTQDRYGADLEIRKYFANGNWSVGAKTGYTGYASYERDTWRYSDPQSLTALLDAEYRYPAINLTLQAIYGRFLYQDRGWRLSVFRRFGEIEIGFFTLRTEIGRNAGFNLRIPLIPSRYSSPGRVRIRPAKEFSYRYYHKRLPKSGIIYETGNDIDAFMKKLN